VWGCDGLLSPYSPTKHDFIVAKYKYLMLLPRPSQKDHVNSIEDLSRVSLSLSLSLFLSLSRFLSNFISHFSFPSCSNSMLVSELATLKPVFDFSLSEPIPTT
jgi:AAA+ ATPase superfamily predicted ATPase